jgi:hypothetical protein
MAILAETCSVLRTLKTLKVLKNFKCECEELTSVCTQDGELIVIEWKVQQDATIKYVLKYLTSTGFIPFTSLELIIQGSLPYSEHGSVTSL